MMLLSRLTIVALAIGAAACLHARDACASPAAENDSRECEAASSGEPPPVNPPRAKSRDDAPMWNLLSRLPLSTRAVVAVQGLAQQLDDTSVSPVRELARARLIDRAVNDAWENLAKRLSWTGREALERLLGSRVVLAIGEAAAAPPRAPPRDAGGKRTRTNPTRIGVPPLPATPAQGLPWAVFSEVDEGVAVKLTVALAGVPRRIEAGRPVYSLEGGAFLLSTSTRVPGGVGGAAVAAGEGGRDVQRTWILVGAREHAAWFDALHASVFGAAAPAAGAGGMGRDAGEGALVRLSATPAYEELARMGLGDVAVLARMNAGDNEKRDGEHRGDGVGAWDGYLAISGRERAAVAAAAGAAADCGGYVASVAFVSAARPTRAMIASYPLVPETRFDALAGGAMAAVVQMSPERPTEGDAPFRGFAIPGLGFSVLGRELDAGGAGGVVGGGGRSIMVLRADAATGRAMLIEAKRVTAVGDAAAPSLDQRMGEVIRGGAGGRGAAGANASATEEAAAVAAMGGLLPGVRRAIVFEPVNASPLRVLVGSRVAAAWVERPTGAPQWGAGGGVEGGAGRGSRWWAAALAGVAGGAGDMGNESSPPGQAARTRASAGLDDVLATIDGSAPPPVTAGERAAPGAEAGGGGNVLRRWVSIGRIDVPNLARLMGVPLVGGVGVGAAGSDVSSLMGKVGVLTWRLWADETGALHGDVHVGAAP